MVGIKIIYSNIFVDEKSINNATYLFTIEKNQSFIPVIMYPKYAFVDGQKEEKITKLYFPNTQINSILCNKYLSHKIKYALWDNVPVKVKQTSGIFEKLPQSENDWYVYKIINEK